MFQKVKMQSLLVSAGLAALVFSSSFAPAIAGTASTTFQVTATVDATCGVSATDLAFGTYAGSQTDNTSTITVTCTNTTPWNIGLNAGTSSGATVTTRAMTGPGSATLNYALYSDSGHSTNWGNTVGTDTVSGTGTGSTQDKTVYGRVAGSQYPAPGSYSDTITATVSW